MTANGERRAKVENWVVHGNPTDEELVAAVMAVTALVSAVIVARVAVKPYSAIRRWSPAVARMTQQPVERGPGAWLGSIRR